MKISLKALKYYVDIDVPVAELCDKMVMAGFEVEEIIDQSQTINNVVVAKIEKLTKHPDADKLLICSMNIGKDEPVQIVTGADNVFEGAVVPAALHNSLLPSGTKITKGKLRGVLSEGMLCSGEELCLKESDMPGAEVHGILILDENLVPGTDMAEVLGLDDFIIDFKITPNRPDCQSIIGVAREVSVVLGKQFKEPKTDFTAKGGNINDYISVEVKDPDLCSRYIGRVVKNLRIAPSPDWLKRTLKAAGMRPINNIVDITNFVMLETGQPMHAFDLNDIEDRKIIVRRAQNGEKITTLDGTECTLNSDMLVIADGKKPSCLAGIMGGLNSEIKPETSDLFLESAKFMRDNVRHTSRALGISTESSSHFEKGIDVFTTEYAMQRAMQLISDLDAGDIVEGIIDIHQPLPEKTVINTTVASINELLGVDIPEKTVFDILNSLQIKTEKTADGIKCTAPTWRSDIECRADLSEEVMRIYGYDHIKGSVMRGDIVRGKLLADRKKTELVKNLLYSLGGYEISTYSFISSKAIDTLNLPDDDSRRKEICILNPLGEEYSRMRTQMITSMLGVMSTNINYGNDSARLFEVSRLFEAKQLPVTEQPNEVPAVCIGMWGKDENFYTAKGMVERLLEIFGVEAEYRRSADSYLHPGRSADVLVDGEKIGSFGQIHPDIAEEYGINGEGFVGEIKLDKLFAAETKSVIYKAISRTPAVVRDLALLCNADLPAGDIEKVIKKAAGKVLESVVLFDIYEGDRIEAGKKSVAYSITLRANDRTLTDEETNAVMDKIISALDKIGAQLRS